MLSSSESQDSESLHQLRFLEAEIRVQVKMEELEKELERTRMLMREIQAIVALPKVVVDSIEPPPQQPMMALFPPFVEESEPPKVVVADTNIPLLSPPIVVEHEKAIKDTLNIAFQVCKSCNMSLVMLRCETCLEWKHVACPKSHQLCSCATTAVTHLQGPLPPVTSEQTRRITNPTPAARQSPPSATTTSLSRAQTFTLHKPRSKMFSSAGNFPTTKSKRLYYRDLLLTKRVELRQLFREQHAIAAARTSPMLIAKRTSKGKWTPLHDDLIKYKLVGHSGTNNKHKQGFIVSWRLNIISGNWLNTGLANGELPISAEFRDPRDTTALNHAIYKLFE